MLNVRPKDSKYEDRAEHGFFGPFQVYVNSFLALMNARYYMQPNDTEPTGISEFRARRPSLHSSSRGSGTENLQAARINMFKTRHDEELQAVKVGGFVSVTLDRVGLNGILH